MLAPTLFILILLSFIKTPKLTWYTTSSCLVILSYLVLSNTLQYQSLYSISPLINIDIQSAVLITLTIWISCLILQASYKIKFKINKPRLFILCIIMLLLVLIFCFRSSSLLHFYIWFEASLLPTIILIILWGYQPERIQARIYLILYTVTASLPLLIAILIIYNRSEHILIFYLALVIPTTIRPLIISIIIFLAFLVKLPLFLVHLWLPKAHVEAPVAGSIILAAVLLKLGGYGLLRIITLLPKTLTTLSSPTIRIALIGAGATSLVCLRQPDLKSIIAYSSVGHIGLICAGAFTGSILGLSASLIIIIAHGFSSSALFCIANITYESVNSRRLTLTKGILILNPIISIWWFLLLCANIAAPPSINLLREILLITASVSFSLYLIIPIIILRFFSVAYSLFVYSRINHGHTLICSNPIHNLYPNQHLLIFIHLVPSLLLITCIPLISNWL